MVQDKTLFVFAHPDDEILEAGKIHYLNRNGNEVYCLWTTNGDLNDDKNRKYESINAMNMLDIDKKNLIFCENSEKDIIDSIRVHDSLDKTVDFIHNLEGHMVNINSSTVYVDAYEGGHLIHDWTNFCTFQAVRRLNKNRGDNISLYAFPQYNLSFCWWRLFSWPPFMRFLVGKFKKREKSDEHYHLTDYEIYLKKELLPKCYPSQKRVFDGLSKIIEKERINLGVEEYRKILFDKDYSKKPSLQLFYEWRLKKKHKIDVVFEDFKYVADKVPAML